MLNVFLACSSENTVAQTGQPATLPGQFDTFVHGNVNNHFMFEAEKPDFH